MCALQPQRLKGAELQEGSLWELLQLQQQAGVQECSGVSACATRLQHDTASECILQLRVQVTPGNWGMPQVWPNASMHTTAAGSCSQPCAHWV